MALTNFSALTDEQKTVWSMDFWKHARNYSFMNKFTGTGQDSLIQRVTELRKDERGARAVITLVADLLGDGIAGDRTLEGNEEAMRSYDQVIRIDQLRHANRNMGKMNDQKSIVRFREQSRDKLAYWMADRMDQLAILTMSGVGYGVHTNGATRVGSDLINLEYAADVKAGSANRAFVWDGTNKVLSTTQTQTDITLAADKPTWEMFVELKAQAKNNYVRPVRTSDGIDFYHAFVTPDAMAALKKDPNFIAMVRDAGVRGASNPLFKGTDTIMVDGIAISEYRHVFNNKGLADGSRWGASGDVTGCRMLFCGAQALAFADIGAASWDEEMFDYENQIGISTGKIFGFLKPQFHTDVTNSVEDFGIMTVDFATGGND